MPGTVAKGLTRPHPTVPGSFAISEGAGDRLKVMDDA